MNPETRLSLLARLQNASDDEAWSEFVELYIPVIYRSARMLGIQDADAEDIVQQVLISVSKTLQRRPHDPSQAKFRTWLSRVIRNTAINLLQRTHPDRATGGSAERKLLADAEVPNDSMEASVLDQEYQRELFRTVALRVQSEFAEDSWAAFWQTTVEGKEIREVALALGKQTGSVYTARSRIMRRIRLEVERLSSEDD